MPSLANRHWDYIIVGAGSGGCLMANKLSDDPAVNVLLLEAGPQDNSLFIRMPAGVAKAIGSKKYNWHYWTAPQKHLNGRRLTTPRGKVIGGSSSINALVYIRGHAEDYNAWQALGCDGWGYSDVLPHFKAVENNIRGTDDYHGGSGPLTVSDPVSNNPMFRAFIGAGEQLGYKHNPDFNGVDQEGFGSFQLNIKNGRRWSAANAFLHPIKNRKNLTVYTDCHVLGLLSQGANIVGVRALNNNRVESLYAQSTVLCAGAIGTPQLLLLAGIGPAEDLAKIGVTPMVNLPGVGKNLHDHLEVKVKCRINQPLSLWMHAKFPNYIFTGAQYVLTGTGVGCQQGLEAGAFIKLDPASAIPDTQLHFINALSFDGGTADDRGHGFAIDTSQLQPESRGTLCLQSLDPAVPPLIDPNYLSCEKDRNMMREGLKKLRELCEQSSLKDYIDTELFPGSTIETDAQLDAVVRASAESIYHPVGTAKMGRGTDAVVDPRSMEVYGVRGLYVADASVMPRIVSGNTNAPTMAVASKAADLILSAK